MSWRDKQWQDPNLTDCVWLTYHYLRLYIYAFAFQALIQRASTDGVKEVFPRGLMGDPDVKFVLEAVSSAVRLSARMAAVYYTDWQLNSAGRHDHHCR